jgi:thymidylate synthase
VSKADLIYNNLIQDILDNGEWDKGQNVRTKWASDGTPAYTKSLITAQMKFDGSEVPILTTKRVAWKSAIHELLWFYVKRTSDVSYLRENKVKIWEEWTKEPTGRMPYWNIGKAYGYQLGKQIRTGNEIKLGNRYIEFEYKNQVDILIDGLKNNPSSRRHIISLWNIDDLSEMALYPCVWNNQWIVQNGKLHLVVQVRSNDMALGNPFNVFQYYVLQRMIAQVTGYDVGTMTFNINNPHVYERHVEGLEEQIERDPLKAPTLWINPEIKNFDDFTIDDFRLDNYDFHPTISFEVAV